MRLRNTTPLAKVLKHPITLLNNITANELEVQQWQEVATTFAEIKAVCDTKFETLEGLNFGHLITEALFIFRIRFIPNLNNKMRILFKDRLFEIKRIINIAEQDRVLQIIALEIA